MLTKLRIKFVAGVMLIVSAILVFAFVIIYQSTAMTLEQSSVNMMETIASASVDLPRPDESPDDVRLPFFTIQVGNDGSITADGGYYDLSDRDFLTSLVEAVSREEMNTAVLEEYNLRYYRLVEDEGQSLVFSDITSERSTLRDLANILAQIGFFCFVVFTGVSALLSVWMLKPIEIAWKRQRQFVSDASHELKTPLTVITTNAELLRGRQCGDDERVRFAGVILSMSYQMRTLVDRMLSLARVDNDQTEPELRSLDFSELVENVVLPFEPVFFERGLELESRIEQGITMLGSDQELRQLVSVLLDNARKYALSSGPVVLRLETTAPRRCVLAVSNRAEDLTEEQLRGIFTRFYRLDTARSLDGSAGLGLPIAENVVKRHQGKMWAESSGGIITFFAELPIKQA